MRGAGVLFAATLAACSGGGGASTGGGAGCVDGGSCPTISCACGSSTVTSACLCEGGAGPNGCLPGGVCASQSDCATVCAQGGGGGSTGGSSGGQSGGGSGGQPCSSGASCPAYSCACASGSQSFPGACLGGVCATTANCGQC
ncbi:MAG: hypothetical protein ACYCWW_14915 [Deltaproteobacteria bacterium]